MTVNLSVFLFQLLSPLPFSCETKEIETLWEIVASKLATELTLQMLFQKHTTPN